MGQLGNGVYTDGNKGSNFSFELKTLKALEQIAILIEAGGAVPGSQNLQDVTTLGNTTTNEMIADGVGFTSQNGGWYGRMTWQGFEFLQGSTTNTLFLSMNNDLTAGRNLSFPDGDGTLVTSVNGSLANTFGDVTLEGACYTPGITSNMGDATFSEITAHYYTYKNMVQVFVKFAMSVSVASGTEGNIDIALPVPVISGAKSAIMGTVTFQANPLTYPVYGYMNQTDDGNQTAVVVVAAPNNIETNKTIYVGASFSYAIDPGTLTC